MTDKTVQEQLHSIRVVLWALALVTIYIGLCVTVRGPLPAPAPRMAPVEYRTNELAPAPEDRETWEEYATRMEAKGRKVVR